MYIVTLSSSADSLCPGDGVVFTCVTDTGRLVWDIKNTAVSFHSSAYLNIPTKVDTVLGRHGSVSLCRVERENKMAATYNVLAFKR